MASREFYERDAWKRLRYRVLRRFGFKCMACKNEGGRDVVLHVDHIKPISIYPELALTEDNLQVLCADCNLGKSNVYEDDHRPKVTRPRPRPAHKVPDELSAKLARLKSSLHVTELIGTPEEQAKLMREYLEAMREAHAKASG